MDTQVYSMRSAHSKYDVLLVINRIMLMYLEHEIVTKLIRYGLLFSTQSVQQCNNDLLSNIRQMFFIH